MGGPPRNPRFKGTFLDTKSLSPQNSPMLSPMSLTTPQISPRGIGLGEDKKPMMSVLVSQLFELKQKQERDQQRLLALSQTVLEQQKMLSSTGKSLPIVKNCSTSEMEGLSAMLALAAA